MPISEKLNICEQSYRALSNDRSEAAGVAAITALSNLISETSPTARELGKKAPLSSKIELATTTAEGRRDIAIFVLRALGRQDLRRIIEERGGDHIERKIVALFEAAAADMATYIGYQDRKLTHEKIDALAGTQDKVEELLEIFQTLPADPHELIARRQEIFKRLSHTFLKSYLNPFCYSEFSNSIRAIINSIADLLETADSSFSSKLPATIELVEATAKKVGRLFRLSESYRSHVISEYGKRSLGRC